MTQDIKDRPLVTFAVFAYNQEKYVREAVEGAFAQTYEPLEIILSDDCSTDRTYEMMIQLAKNYKGPHSIHIRREERNSGTLNHVLNVADKARGTYLVLAAGDDISAPQRCAEIVEGLGSSSPVAGYSDQSVIDEFGKDLECHDNREKPRRHASILKSSTIQPVHGATSFYRTEFLRKFPRSRDNILIEDYIFSVFSAAYGYKSLYIDKPLVKYRHHDQNISIREAFGTSLASIREKESRQNIRRREFEKALRYIKALVEGPDHKNSFIKDRFDFEELDSKIDFLRLAARWPKLNVQGKLLWLKLGLRTRQSKIVFPRLFGIHAFWALRRILGVSD